MAVYQIALENRDQVDAVKTDFAKAFGINFKIFVAKIAALGFSVLLGRTQSVQLQGCVFRVFEVTLVVPQGSHCDPHPYLLFINDITEGINHSKSVRFADDLKIYKVICCEIDTGNLQLYLNAFW